MILSKILFLGHQFIALKTDKGKESRIYLAFLVQTAFQCNQMVNEGKFFVEEFQLIRNDRLR